ncbi:MAG: oxidoreductase, partial [Bacteroidetes bacterium]
MKNLLLILLLLATNAYSQPKIQVLDSNTFLLKEGVVLSKTSFRGLSVVDDQTIWVSGSRGTFAKSVDGGKTVVYTQLNGYEKADFRDIEAFDDKRAIMMSSGTPALILKTVDGGEIWKEVFRRDDSAYFLDAMDFWDEKRGMLVGDPINGHFVLLETNDGGETWRELDSTKTPEAYDGEAVFAASGTSLRCASRPDELFFAFVTGGSKVRFLEFSNVI